eukprot:2715564-Amphidinium_carterae.1
MRTTPVASGFHSGALRPRDSLASSCALEESCSHDSGDNEPHSRMATSLSTSACDGSVSPTTLCPGSERRRASS